MTSNIKQNESSRPMSRPVRVPLHKQNVFTAELREGFKRMWVNETLGNVSAYELAGWAVVKDAGIKTHDGQAQIESQMDSVARRVVNKSPDASCRTAVLMEIPLELYEEDQAAEQKTIDQQEKLWNKKRADEYGEVNITY